MDQQLPDAVVDAHPDSLGHREIPKHALRQHNDTNAPDSSLQSNSTLLARPVSLDLRDSRDHSPSNSSHLGPGSAQAALPDFNTTLHSNPVPVDNPPIEPDDFYRTYRGPGVRTDPTLATMAATATSASLHVQPNSLERNALNHSTVPTNLGVPRSNARSVSSPLDSKTSTARGPARPIPTGKPSVKDLKKRFDQNAAAAAGPIVPNPPSQVIAVSKPMRSSIETTGNENVRASSVSRLQKLAGDSAMGTYSLPLRQTEPVGRDRAPSHTQSFADRVGKPRGPVSEDRLPQISATGTSRDPLSHDYQQSTNISHFKGYLFGEMIFGQNDIKTDNSMTDTRFRRTSESSVPKGLNHRRSLSGTDIASPSLSAWSHNTVTDPIETPSISQPHPRYQSRARSDGGGSSSSPSQVPQGFTASRSTQVSKLPIYTRNLRTPSNASESSTSSCSPTTLRRSQANGRLIRSSPNASRAKTPTQTPKAARNSITPSNSSTKFKAYISSPPAKQSPTLRSSRPRQHVSTMSTADSKTREKTRPGKVIESLNKRRKISIGPVDFEQRREHIKLAYSKSIRQSAVLEARQKDARKHTSDTKTTISTQHDLNGLVHKSDVANSSPMPDTSNISAVETCPVDSTSPSHPANTATTETYELVGTKGSRDTTQMATPSLKLSTKMQTIAASLDSPTLGLREGTSSQNLQTTRDEPVSAVSGASDITEFDAEPQVNPPVQAQSPLGISTTSVKTPSPHNPQQSSSSLSDYQTPMEDDPDSSFGASPEAEPEPTTASTHALDSDCLPGSASFIDDHQPADGLGISSFQPQGTSITLVAASESQGSNDTEAQMIPFPNLESSYDSDCCSDPAHVQMHPINDIRRDDDALTDTCTEDTDDLNQQSRHLEYQDDQSRSYRTSTCASSDAGNYDNTQYSNYEQQPLQALDTSSNNYYLTPHAIRQEKRLSKQSTWTDYSVDSADQHGLTRSSAMESGSDSPAFGHATIFCSKRESSFSEVQQSISEDRRSGESRRLSTQSSSCHVPEVDAGDSFSVPYVSTAGSASVSYLPSPVHQPPPIPLSAPGSGYNSRASSAVYENSQYSGFLPPLGRKSDDYTSAAGTSLSVDSTSFTTTDYYLSTQTPADSDTKSLGQDSAELSDKDRHRLIQRRNVIKELVDTEAVFVRDMNIVEEIYKGTAEACPELDSKTIKLIFRNSDDIIAFHSHFLVELKAAVSDVYVPKSGRSVEKDGSTTSSTSFVATGEPNDAKDRNTTLGTVFKNNIEQMKLAHEGFLRASDQAAKRLIQIQQDPTVQVWLNECHEVAKDLTAAWDLDSLLIKPMQRITKYPNLLITLLQHTPKDHPDREFLMEARDVLETAIIDINKAKKNFELVGQIVGRKRKESDVRVGFARAFGKRVDKLQTSNHRITEDAEYAKLNERFGDDYLRLQVVLRDVEFYTRQVSAYVHEFLQYMSSVELVMRFQPGSYPEIENKWVQFNISVRDLEKVALEEHLVQVRRHVIEPFEHVIKAYGNPSLAMKKRQKRRLDFERFEQLKRSGKNPDPKLKEQVEQYEALNDTLKKELPKLSALTETMGNICLGSFVNIQTRWYEIWKEKMKTVLMDCPDVPDLQEIVSTFQQEYPYVHDQLASIGILNSASWGRVSVSTNTSVDDVSLKIRTRPSSRTRGQSVNDEGAPALPAPDFGRRRSGSLIVSPNSNGRGNVFGNGSIPSPHQYYYRDYYADLLASHGGSPSPASPEVTGNPRSATGGGMASRPSSFRSYDSNVVRPNSDSTAPQYRDSNQVSPSDYLPQETQREQRFSNLFRSALPLSDGPEDNSRRTSRASSRDRNQTSDGYNVLWLAASLFEFNISTTKHEAGYPYLTYQAGEIFDVIAEKGELWLAQNQDDLSDQVGWIWSKHFAKLADS